MIIDNVQMFIMPSNVEFACDERNHHNRISYEQERKRRGKDNKIRGKVPRGVLFIRSLRSEQGHPLTF